ncbi:MAG TPA: molybdenum cofactor guanylyltransferase [Alphaproteobacteria bacterium]|nr:molybdenum cofactor guanylyltransferase [Alphaproteobacteria bacterium]
MGASFADAVGIVLAGGLSSRMGQNKALLSFHGTPLVKRMLILLRAAGVVESHVSGKISGFSCIEDVSPHAGPAQAMRHLAGQVFAGRPCLFVPVDMPLLTPEILRALLARGNSCFFKSFPLPAVLKYTEAGEASRGDTVRSLLTAQNAEAVPLRREWGRHFLNANTPDEWEEAIRR